MSFLKAEIEIYGNTLSLPGQLALLFFIFMFLVLFMLSAQSSVIMTMMTENDEHNVTKCTICENCMVDSLYCV